MTLKTRYRLFEIRVGSRIYDQLDKNERVWDWVWNSVGLVIPLDQIRDVIQDQFLEEINR